ncbi:MAG: hypothetical protein JG777_138 [Clostridia bacterium]|nr:hypothetical protein [Clostridia bacterium]
MDAVVRVKNERLHILRIFWVGGGVTIFTTYRSVLLPNFKVNIKNNNLSKNKTLKI